MPSLRILVLTLLVIPLGLPSAALAQVDEQTTLLRAMLCELRELRGALSHSQILVPLVEANSRERTQLQVRLSELAEQRSKVDVEVQDATARQAKIREILQQLARPQPKGSPSEHPEREREQAKRQWESAIGPLTRKLQTLRANDLRLATRSSTIATASSSSRKSSIACKAGCSSSPRRAGRHAKRTSESTQDFGPGRPVAAGYPYRSDLRLLHCEDDPL